VIWYIGQIGLKVRQDCPSKSQPGIIAAVLLYVYGELDCYSGCLVLIFRRSNAGFQLIFKLQEFIFLADIRQYAVNNLLELLLHAIDRGDLLVLEQLCELSPQCRAVTLTQ